MKKNIFKVLLVFIVALLFIPISCDRVEDIDDEGTSTQDMAGDWFVTRSVGGVEVSGHVLISTYNTSANNGSEMWIDDHEGNIWGFADYPIKFKTPINYSQKTFGGSSLQNLYQDYDITINVSDGKILKDAATTSGGNKSDSIIFKAEFSDEPGVIYTFAGYKRTGFAEDEH
ncbi:hypothetical protein HNP38_002717 [Chryseobacterium defluvii]|uniref:Uncharacterized protein n=1 Tax=Chryseobacterium defluvii TaxID=160396 RepID=A0A840KDE1_9FLAO|nr:lipid-binding protein [Chryseobacterium defluvii]MBB4807411.1 hypothetical protein [Chryseobacterium defluvii]